VQSDACIQEYDSCYQSLNVYLSLHKELNVEGCLELIKGKPILWLQNIIY